MESCNNHACVSHWFSFDLVMPGIDWSDIDHGLSDSDYGYDEDDEYKDDYGDVWGDETTCFKFSTTTTSPTTTETSEIKSLSRPTGAQRAMSVDEVGPMKPQCTVVSTPNHPLKASRGLGSRSPRMSSRALPGGE